MQKLSTVALAFLVVVCGVSAAGNADARSSAASARPHRVTRRAKISATEARRRSGDARPDGKPDLHGKAIKSESIGSPNEGHLEGGVHLDLAHPYLRVVNVYQSGDVRWGLPELVNMIDRSAKAVNKRFPGSQLDVGDLSRKGGGDLLRHHSHESGRDADLGFYAVDGKGRQVHAHSFIKFETGTLDSTNVPGARFDLARNWFFVQELVSDPRARVSHVFVSEPLKQLLLGYARTHGVSRALIDRVAMVMMQPHNSLPHDDHFHVRISCPASMRGVCVELAKGALASRHRMAQRTHAAHPHHAILKTPSSKPPPMSAVAPQDDESKQDGDESGDADVDSFDVRDSGDDATPKLTD